MGNPDSPTRRFLFDANLERAELRSFAGGTALVFSARSPGEETPNEDAVALIELAPDHGVLAVADGVGGMPAGDRAARVALEELARVLDEAMSEPAEESMPPGWLRAAIVDGIERANRAVIEAGSGATTLAIAEVQGHVTRSYHVGDSTIVITGLRGRVKMQTIAHSPVGYAIESGMLDEREALVHEDRHLVSNTLGSDAMRIEIGPAVALAPRDTLILATDGLSDNMYPNEIIEVARKGPLERVARTLIQASRGRMSEPEPGHPSKPDDLSFAIFRPLPRRQ